MSPEKKKKDEETEAEEAKPTRRRTRAKAKPAAEKAEKTKATETAEAKESGEEKPARKRPSRAKKPAAEEAAAAEDAPAEEEPAEEAPADAAKPAKPAKPAPARKRGADEPVTAPPVVRAKARYVRSSPRKARLVCDHIRGKDVEEARAILRYAPRAVARDWAKLLESAVANAEHNHELVGDDLRIHEAFADDGPTLKRYRPRAMGRATPIAKRTSHLTITLTPKENA